MKKFIICILFLLFMVSCKPKLNSQLEKINSLFEGEISVYMAPIDSTHIIVDSSNTIRFIQLQTSVAGLTDVTINEPLIKIDISVINKDL